MIIHLKHVLFLFKTIFLSISLACLFNLKIFGSDHTDFSVVITEQSSEVLFMLIEQHGTEKEIQLMRETAKALDQLIAAIRENQAPTSEFGHHSKLLNEHDDLTNTSGTYDEVDYKGRKRKSDTQYSADGIALPQTCDHIDGKQNGKKRLKLEDIVVRHDPLHAEKAITGQPTNMAEPLQQAAEVISNTAAVLDPAASQPAVIKRHAGGSVKIIEKQLPEQRLSSSHQDKRFSSFSTAPSLAKDPIYQATMKACRRSLVRKKQQWQEQGEINRNTQNSASLYDREFSEEPYLVKPVENSISQRHSYQKITAAALPDPEQENKASLPPPLPPKPLQIGGKFNTESQNNQLNKQPPQQEEQYSSDDELSDTNSDDELSAAEQRLPYQVTAWENDKLELYDILNTAQKDNITTTKPIMPKQAIKALEGIILVLFEKMYERLPTK